MPTDADQAWAEQVARDAYLRSAEKGQALIDQRKPTTSNHPHPMNPELPTSPAARTSNRLTLEQTFALGAWITSHHQQAQDESDTQCAEHAAIDLKFTVTPANFAAARQALHIEKTRPATPPTLEERVAELESWGGRVGFKDLLFRLTKLEQRNQPEVQLPLPLPGRMATEMPTSDIECSTPFEDFSTATEPGQGY